MAPDYTCGGGIIMNVSSTIDVNGVMTISATKKDGTAFGSGDYYAYVFEPNDGVASNHCKQFNVPKGHIVSNGGESVLTFNSFPSQLICAGAAKGYCVTKSAGGDNAWFCSNESYATYK